MKDSITWTRTGHICVNVTKHSCRSKYVLHRFSVVHNIPSCIQSWYNTDKMHLLEWTVTVTRARVRVRVVILSLQCWQRAAIFICYGSLSCGIRDIASSNSFAHRVLTKKPLAQMKRSRWRFACNINEMYVLVRNTILTFGVIKKYQ